MTWIESVIGKWVIKYRWQIIVVAVVLTCAAGPGLRFLTINNDTRVFFSKANPQFQALEEMEKTFSRVQNVIFVLAPDDQNVFTCRNLTAVSELTEACWKVPYSTAVGSITNIPYTRVVGDEIVVESLVPNPSESSPEELERIKKIALSDVGIRDLLISSRGHVTGVQVSLIMPGKSTKEISEVAIFARKMMDTFRQRYPNIAIYLTGSVMIDNAFGEASRKDLLGLVPVMFLTMTVIVWMVLRSFLGTLAGVTVISLSIITGLGVIGWLGMSLNAVSVGAPGLILTLAVADNIHVLAPMFRLIRKRGSKYEGIAECLEHNFYTVFLTNITTIIGFLTMNSSESPPFRDLGNIVAVGLTVAFLYSVLLLPAIIAVLPIPIRAERKKAAWITWDRWAGFVIKKRDFVFWGTLALTVIIVVVGIPKIELDDNFLTYFDDSFEFRRATDFMIENLSGWDLIEYSLESGQSGGIADPQYMDTVDRFASWYRQQPKVVHVHTIVDTMKRLNRDMHDGDENYYRIPEQRELAAQYLLLCEISRPFGFDLNSQINVDKSSTRLFVLFKSMSAVELRRMDDIAQNWLKSNAPQYMFTSGTGLSMIWANITERNINSMLTGTLWELIVISGIMILVLRSLKLGFISLVPNILPPIVAFGIWGLIAGRVGLALSVVAAITVGIIVDDTVHFLVKYKRAIRDEGMTPTEAVRHTFQMVGTSMLATTGVLSAGFLILTVSHYRMSSEMGVMSVMIFGVAILMDFLLTPTLLLKLERRTDKLTGKQK